MNTTATRVNARGIDAIHILTQDLDRALAFYRDVIGLRVAWTNPAGYELELEDGSAFGIAKMPDVFFPGGGMMFAVDDIDASYAALQASGVKLHTEIEESPVCRIAWAADTEGNYFAIHQRNAR